MHNFSNVKRKLLSLILAGVVASSGMSAFASGSAVPFSNTPVNLIQNADFENPNNSTANWTISGNAWIINYNSYSGKSIHLDAGSNNTVKQSITVAQSGTYTASAWISTGGTGGKFSVRDVSSGAILAQATLDFNTTYTKYTLPAVELTAGQPIEIICAGGNGWVRGDEFSFTASGVFSDENLFANPHFDAGASGWNFQGSAGIANNNPYEGSHFYLDAGSANKISQTVTVPSAGYYHSSVWLSGSGEDASFSIRDTVTGNILQTLSVISSNDYTYYELPPVALTANQQIEIACTAGTGWVNGDSFGLYSVTDLLTNGTFESGATQPDGWNMVGWMMDRTSYNYLSAGGVDGGKCIGLATLTEENDAHWAQSLQLQPNTQYTLTGYMKAENITGSGVTGLHVNIPGNGTYASTFPNLYAHSKPGTKGTFDWKPFTVKFMTGSDGNISIECRLGYYSSTVIGTAYFDNLVLFEDKTARLMEASGTNVSVFTEHFDRTTITDANMAQWVARLNSAYNAYADLTGHTPFGGGHINILSDSTNMPVWAYSGNNIMWNRDYVGSELAKINGTDDWSFGILHEISHNFDLDEWSFDAELMANFKMYYAMDTLNGKVTQDRQYTGTALENYYKTNALESYSKTIEVRQNGYSGDGVTYTLIRIQKAVGWAPFKAAFREFQTLINPPQTSLAKFDKLLELIQKNYSQGGTQVYDTFPAGELDYVRGLL